MERLSQYELSRGSDLVEDSVLIRDRNPPMPQLTDNIDNGPGEEEDEENEEFDANDDVSISSDVDIPLYSEEWCRRFVKHILAPDVPVDTNGTALRGDQIRILENTKWWKDKKSVMRVARGILSASISRSIEKGKGGTTNIYDNNC